MNNEYIKSIEEQNEQLRQKLEETELKLASVTSPMKVQDLYDTIAVQEGNFKVIAHMLVPKLLLTKEECYTTEDLTYLIPGSGDRYYTIEMHVGQEFVGFWNTVFRRKSFFVMFSFEDSNDTFGSNLRTKIVTKNIVESVYAKLVALNVNERSEKIVQAEKWMRKFLGI